MTMGLNDWTIETQNGWNIQFYKEKNYFPKIWIYNKNFYDHETAGHLREIGTYNAVQQQWPGLHTFVKNYVQGCGACQQFKIDWSPSKPAYIPTEGTKSLWPFANCSIDLITDLSLADGFDSILVMVDQGFSKIFDTMPQNNHFWRHCSSIIGKSLQVIWTSRQNYLWQGTLIHIKSIQRTSKSTRDQISTVYSLPSPNRWNNRMSKSKNQSIPVNLLCFSSGRMALSITHIGIHSSDKP